MVRSFLAGLVVLGSVMACSSSSPSSPVVGAPGAGGASSSGGGQNASSSSSSGGGGGGGGGAVMPGWGPQACKPADGAVGFGVGQTLGDLGVRDCDTDAPANLDDLCGAEATWIFSAHTHCPTCQQTARFTAEVAESVRDKNVAVAMVVYDDNGTSCAKWRETYKLAGLPNVRVYSDPGGAVFSKLKTSNFTAPSAFLNQDRVVTYKEHGLSKARVLSQIDAALSK
jgi:thiol-disulfide isomerase/thioredoxin